jgi:hypothetical protein
MFSPIKIATEHYIVMAKNYTGQGQIKLQPAYQQLSHPEITAYKHSQMEKRKRDHGCIKRSF